ncbi:M20/M25/M40 family metallo-hydrolase [Candidatus Peregrinibacteria bacterium]|nr:M20/M25/M40 family metallo-hydrolase [Candidatus Peregrinibacteria bacterium]
MFKIHDALKNIQPEGVARHFDAIRRIPRGSGNEASVRRYLKKWAGKNHFVYRTDFIGNSAIDIPASKGVKAGRVLLQMHMDMVCVKRPGVLHDFKKDPIDLERKGDRIHTKGRKTTLGADNGLGVAMALAIAEDRSFKHPSLTILATVAEEKGMIGALELGKAMIPRSVTDYINLDAEEGPEWVCCGSAGVVNLRAKWPLSDYFMRPQKEAQPFSIQLKGLWGGHSGIDIHKGRGNAILFLKDFLKKIQKQFHGFILGDFRGGQAGNAIPPAASAIIFLKKFQQEALEIEAKTFETFLRSELGKKKGGKLRIKIKKIRLKKKDQFVWSSYVVNHLFRVLDKLPDGSIKRKDNEHVIISNNIGMVYSDKDYLKLVCFSRYDPHQQKVHERVLRRMITLLEKEGGVIRRYSDIGWEEPDTSRLITLAKSVGASQGHKVQTFTYHASLEVGVIRERLKSFGHAVDNLSAIAFGPIINEGHSTHENFEISSLQPTYDLLRGILEELAKP